MNWTYASNPCVSGSRPREAMGDGWSKKRRLPAPPAPAWRSFTERSEGNGLIGDRQGADLRRERKRDKTSPSALHILPLPVSQNDKNLCPDALVLLDRSLWWFERSEKHSFEQERRPLVHK